MKFSELPLLHILSVYQFLPVSLSRSTYQIHFCLSVSVSASLSLSVSVSPSFNYCNVLETLGVSLWWPHSDLLFFPALNHSLTIEIINFQSSWCEPVVRWKALWKREFRLEMNIWFSHHHQKVGRFWKRFSPSTTYQSFKRVLYHFPNWFLTFCQPQNTKPCLSCWCLGSQVFQKFFQVFFFHRNCDDSKWIPGM